MRGFPTPIRDQVDADKLTVDNGVARYEGIRITGISAQPEARGFYITLTRGITEADPETPTLLVAAFDRTGEALRHLTRSVQVSASRPEENGPFMAKVLSIPTLASQLSPEVKASWTAIIEGNAGEPNLAGSPTTWRAGGSVIQANA